MLNFVPIQAKITDVFGDDLKVVNAARGSFGKKSEYLPDGSLSPADQGLIQQLASGYTRTELKTLLDSFPRLFIGEGVDYYDLPPVEQEAVRAELLHTLEKYKAHEPHDTPFNHCAATAVIKVPIFVARQLVKSEYFIWSEISRRYVGDLWEFWRPGLSDGCVWRAAPQSKKQGSGDPLPAHLQNELNHQLEKTTTWAHEMFVRTLESGACMEQARAFLPQNTMVDVTITSALSSFAKMIRLRLSPTAQQETQYVARMLAHLLTPHFPISVPALLKGVL